jgi:hypothetical protein
MAPIFESYLPAQTRPYRLYPPPGTLNTAPTAYPTSALAVPISAISSPLFPGWPTVTRAL